MKKKVEEQNKKIRKHFLMILNILGVLLLILKNKVAEVAGVGGKRPYPRDSRLYDKDGNDS